MTKLISKEWVLELLDDLREQVYWYREEGEGDMRSVIHHVEHVIAAINKAEGDTND
jgi:hypothetical protein